MDFNNKPEQGFGGDFSTDNTFDNTNNFGGNDTLGNNVYSAPNQTPGNGVYTPNPAPGNSVYTPNPAPMDNTYGGGSNYYSNPTPPGDFDRFNSFGGQKETPVSVGDWMLSYLVMCIPCVGLIMMFVWAFSSGTKKSKSNYFKAMLIWALIGTVLTVVLYALMFAGIIAVGSGAGAASYY